MFDVYKIREDFPILDRKVNNTDLVYFDNAATSQTPIQVIDAISNYYKNYKMMHNTRMILFFLKIIIWAKEILKN